MPYSGVPDNLTKKMDSCVSQVMAKEPGMSKSRAVAICKSRIVPKLDGDKVKARSSDEHSVSVLQSRPVQSPIRKVADGRFKCYAMRFNGPEEKDAYGTYFNANTRYYLEYWNTRPWLYDHGLNPTVGRSKIGDWDEIGIDDQGVFVQGELDRHHKYCMSVEALIDEGVLYPSSGALDYLVRIADDGHVEDWPIGEVTSTVRPADWRMLDSVSPAARTAMRSLLDDYITEVRDMGTKDDLLKLFGLRAQDVEDLDADKSDDDAATEPDAEGDGASEGDDQQGNIDDGEPVAGLSTVQEPDAELIRSVVEIVGVEFKTVRTAIEALDGAVRNVSETLDQHSKLLAGVATTETERTQRALVDGDWLGSLYVASRSDDAPEATDDESKNAKKQGATRNTDATGWELISGAIQ